MRHLFVLLMLSSLSYGQERYHESKVVCPNDTITYLKFDMKPLNGIVYGEFGDVGEFVDGKKEGIHRRWHENGQLWLEVNYKDGKQDGVHRSWYENGQLGYEANYKDWKLNGVERQWHTNGQLRIERNFKNWKLDGLDRSWHENGQLKYEINWKDGKFTNDKVIFYDEDGVIKGTQYWEDGEYICEGNCDYVI